MAQQYSKYKIDKSTAGAGSPRPSFSVSNMQIWNLFSDSPQELCTFHRFRLDVIYYVNVDLHTVCTFRHMLGATAQQVLFIIIIILYFCCRQRLALVK